MSAADQRVADWSSPGTFEVAPGVHRIPLPLPNDGLRAVNVYAVPTDDGLTLIDAGWSLAESRDLLAAGLSSLGASLGDVRRFLVTHAHRDHYTQAVTLRRETGAHISLGAGERPTIELLQQAERAALLDQAAHLRRLGAPALADTMTELMRGHRPDPTQWESPDTWLEPGPVPLPGGRVLEAVETPGHTAGHVVFYDVAGGLLFAGDHVLPTITPSIGFEAVLSTNPLGAFLRSLAVVRARPDALLLPAHGAVAPSVHDRVDELVDHHGRRLDEAQVAVEGGADTAYDVARCLRWTRRLHRVEDLDAFNAMLAVSETGAHLELLVAQARLRTELLDGVSHYRV